MMTLKILNRSPLNPYPRHCSSASLHRYLNLIPLKIQHTSLIIPIPRSSGPPSTFLFIYSNPSHVPSAKLRLQSTPRHPPSPGATACGTLVSSAQTCKTPQIPGTLKAPSPPGHKPPGAPSCGCRCQLSRSCRPNPGKASKYP